MTLTEPAKILMPPVKPAKVSISSSLERIEKSFSSPTGTFRITRIRPIASSIVFSYISADSASKTIPKDVHLLENRWIYKEIGIRTK